MSKHKKQSGSQLAIIVFVGFAGTTLVISGGQLDFTNVNIYGFIAAFISAVCMAIYSVGIGNTSAKSHDVLFAGSLIGLPITFIWCLVGQSEWTSIKPTLLERSYRTS